MKRRVAFDSLLRELDELLLGSPVDETGASAPSTDRSVEASPQDYPSDAPLPATAVLSRSSPNEIAAPRGTDIVRGSHSADTEASTSARDNKSGVAPELLLRELDELLTGIRPIDRAPPLQSAGAPQPLNRTLSVIVKDSGL